MLKAAPGAEYEGFISFLLGGVLLADVERIGPQEAWQHLESDGALLVCAYDSEKKFQDNQLKRAISLDEFNSRIESIPKDRELIFYCD